MAGIGFALQKLTSRDDLLGIARAYTHAAFASAGPWLFTVLAIGGITLLYANAFALEQLINFRIIVVYNFSFSLVISAAIFMVVTRYLADAIHLHNVTLAPSVLFVSMILTLLLQVPVAIVFYLWYVEMDLVLKLSAIVNLFLISIIWLLAVFMTALKDYLAVTRAFAIGMILAVLLAQAWKDPYGDAGMLNGFSIGLAYIAFALAAKIMAEYPYRLNATDGFKYYFRKYWELIVGGVMFNAAMWVDKWIMWVFAPEAVELPNKMRMMPDYDSAMFLAYLTIVPAMAVFVFSVETNFFLHYKKFYYDLLEHKPLKRIRENQQAIMNSIFGSARNFLVVQGTVCLVCVLMAVQLLELFNLSYSQVGIFRLGCLGALFQVLMLFEHIILSYFDCRRVTMWIQIGYFFMNAIFTYITLDMGFPYYGYGFFLASVLGFVISSLYLFNHVRKLPYHAFITHNNSIKGVFQRTGYIEA